MHHLMFFFDKTPILSIYTIVSPYSLFSNFPTVKTKIFSNILLVFPQLYDSILATI